MSDHRCGRTSLLSVCLMSGYGCFIYSFR
jgi:hypothetical protein